MDPLTATAPRSQKNAARRRQLFALGSIALVLLVGAIVVDSVATSRWKEFADRRKVVDTRSGTNTGARTPLAGPATTGNSWDEYVAAIASLARVVEGSDLAGSEFGVVFARTAPEPDSREGAEKLRKFLPKATGALNALRAATHRERAAFPMEWDKGTNDSIPLDIVSGQRLSRLLVFNARERLAAGDRAGALNDLTAALQFDVDLARAPYLLCAMVGFAEMKFVAQELKHLVADPATPAADLERIRATTESADHLLPSPGDTYTHDGLILSRKLQEVGDGNSDVYDMFGASRTRASGVLYLASTWRYWFSRRLALLDANRSFEVAAESFRVGTTEDLVSASARYQALSAFSGNPIVHLAVSDEGLTHQLCQLDFHWRTARARLRLICAGCMIREGRGPSDPGWPADPVDLRPLRCRDVDGAIRIWSLCYAPSDDDTGRWTWEVVDEDHLLEIKGSANGG